MIWFIAMVAGFNGVPVDALQTAAAQMRFPSQRACLIEGAQRARALMHLGAHGKLLCMYHNEPAAELAAAVKVTF